MRRLHLFEFEDQIWFPASLRRAMTAYLASAYRITPFPKLWAELLTKVMKHGETAEIVDLGSGSGGPIQYVLASLEERGYRAIVTLTDLYPSRLDLSRAGGTIRYWPKPVDATCVPTELAGIRTMFASFHHFRAESAQRILRDAFEQGRAICVFEGTARATGTVASSILIPFLVLILTPTIRPLAWVQILFTYLIPILPLLMFWDGLVSHLRTYSEEELRDFTRDLRAEEYVWECGAIEIPRMPAAIPYLIGRPIEPVT